MANDPTSGNTIPPGGTAKGVRDDIPAMLSEGEYIVPANVVNFLGLDKLEKMVLKAKEKLAEMGKQEKELTLDGDPMVTQKPVEMAEGGPVNAFEDILPQDKGFTGIKQFKDSDGRIFFVPYQNGKSFINIPEGAVPVDQEAVTKDAPDPLDNVYTGDPNNPVNARNDPSKNEGAGRDYGLAKSPTDWSFDDYITYGDNKGGVGENAMKGLISGAFGGLGGLALKARDKFRDPLISDGYDMMLKNNTDLQGNPLNEQQRSELVRVTNNIKEDLSKESGLDLIKTPTIRKTVDSFLNFVTGQPSGGGATSAPKAGTNMLAAPESDSGKAQTNPGNYGMGSDLGRDDEDGPSSGSMASGGLY